jgi:Cu(I)/Ag(I) efflux system membrane fusion protein
MSRRSTVLTVALLALTAAALPACRREGAAPAAAASAALYICPMHPDVRSDEPGSCPICGMDLVKAEPAVPAVAGGPPPPSGIAGRAGVTLSAERRQVLGVRSQEIHHARLERAIRTVGRIAVDERRLHHVHAKLEGYVERLHVDFTGAFVRKGDPLLSIYSPELVATQQEYLLAFRAQQRLGGSPVAATARGSAELLEAARQRLLLWDIRSEDIATLERSGQVTRTLDLHSDISGYVVQKTVFHGMRVMPQDTLFDIADLSRLWVLADVYESDLPAVRVGMTGEVTVPYLPGRGWRGPVTYVAPTVEPATRTVKVRLEIDNTARDLKPEMYADVVLRPSLGSGLIVPESAIIDTGDRQIVFVDRGEGRLEPREILVGPKVDGGVHVLGGLEDGETVVISANFLIDSESSLKAALSGIARGTTPAPATLPAGVSPAAAPSRPGPPRAPSPAPPDPHEHRRD